MRRLYTNINVFSGRDLSNLVLLPCSGLRGKTVVLSGVCWVGEREGKKELQSPVRSAGRFCSYLQGV